MEVVGYDSDIEGMGRNSSCRLEVILRGTRHGERDPGQRDRKRGPGKQRSSNHSVTPMVCGSDARG